MLEDLQAARGGLLYLGCTRLPLAVEQLSLSGSFVDATLELAKAAIRFVGAKSNNTIFKACVFYSQIS